MSLRDLADLIQVPGFETAVSALSKLFDAVEKVNEYNDRCKQLRDRWTKFLLTLRDISEGTVLSDYMKGEDGVDHNIVQISSEVLTWSTWGKPESLLRRSEIWKGLERDFLLFKVGGDCFGLRGRLQSGLETLSRWTSHPPGANAIAGGGYADVSQGSFKGQTVAVKVLRLFGSSGRRIPQIKLLRRLWREYLAWSQLSHPNVLQCLGFSYDFSPDPHMFPSLISPWMSNGTIISYIENHPDADRLELLVGVAEGLSYLHSRESAIIHGDLRAGNVLVSDHGFPCLSDFGLSRILTEARGMTTSSDFAGSLRWVSPELLHNNDGVSVKSDIWAYGMTILEVLSGEHPYAAEKSDLVVFGQIKDGKIPARPEDPKVIGVFSDDVWAVCLYCWSVEPMKRPSMFELKSKLRDCWSPQGAAGLESPLEHINGVDPPSPSPVYQPQGVYPREQVDSASRTPRSPNTPVKPVGSHPTLDSVSNGFTNPTKELARSPMSLTDADVSIDKPVYIKSRADGTVEAGTLPGLVERLILGSTDSTKDREFRDTFLVSYPAFSNAEELFNLLLERFNAVSSSRHTVEQQVTVWYSVLRVLHVWLQDHYTTLKYIPPLKQMREFAMSIPPTPQHRAALADLLKLIDSTQAMITIVPSPALPSSLGSTSNLEAISAQDLALALTMLESARYQKIVQADFIYWLEGIHESNGISIFIAENNRLSYWVQNTILRPDDQSQRSSNLQYLLLVAKECLRLRNFSSTCAIFAGLASYFITGLKNTFILEGSNSRIYAEGGRIMSPDKNFHDYRQALNASRDPCVPWLRVHLHDINLIHDSHRTAFKYTDVINFGLYQRIHEQSKLILSYQNPPLKPANSDHYADIQVSIDARLHSLVIDDANRERLRERAARLARQELAHSAFQALKLNLRAVGLRGVTTTALPTSHSTSTTSLPLLSTSHNAISDAIWVSDYENPFDLHSKHCLNGRVTHVSQHPVIRGGYVDIWKGYLATQKVAIKSRPFSVARTQIEESKLIKRLWREYLAWSRVSHPNVLQDVGFLYQNSPDTYAFPSLVSPWMPEGTVFEYIHNHPTTDLLKLLSGVAAGLAYLHTRDPPIVHGDLRAGRILMSESGVPRLQFGLSRLLQDEIAGSLRWMAPELLRDDTIASTSSDVWAYGMTALEITSGMVPYADLHRDMVVFGRVKFGQVPLRPRGKLPFLTDVVWAMCQQCWTTQPTQRPSMQEVMSKFPVPQ